MKNKHLLLSAFVTLVLMNSCTKKHYDPFPGTGEHRGHPYTGQTLTIQTPAYTEDATVWSYNGGNEIPLGNEPWLVAGSWRGVEDIYGTFYEQFIYLQFNYNLLPADAVLKTAKITLYADTSNPGNMPKYITIGHSVEDPSKNLVISAAGSSWNSATLTYFNQPSFTSVHAVAAPAPLSNAQAYTFDVTDIVRDQLLHGNYGFRLSISSFSGHNRWMFYSTETEYASLRPKLVIEY